MQFSLVLLLDQFRTWMWLLAAILIPSCTLKQRNEGEVADFPHLEDDICTNSLEIEKLGSLLQ